MAKLGISTGTIPNDGTGDSLISGAIKINSNFNELYNLLGDGTTLTSGIVTSIVAGSNVTVSGATGQVIINADSPKNWETTAIGIHTLSNVGIGTTNPTSALTVAGDGYFTGIITATSFSGSITNAVYATTAGVSTYSTSSGIATYATTAGVSTYSTSSGIATYATTAGVSTSVIGGVGSITHLSVSGVSTLGNTVVGGATTQLIVGGDARVTGILTIGTASITLNGITDTLTVPNLVVTNSTTGVVASGVGITVRDGGGDLGSAEIIDFGDNLTVTFASGIATVTGSAGGGESSQWVTTAAGIHTLSNVGVGTTNPTSKLSVTGDGYFTGIITATSFSGSGSNLTGIVTGITAGANITVLESPSGNFIITSTASGGGSSQWVSTDVGIHTLSNVGVGTTNPITQLQVDRFGTEAGFGTFSATAGVSTTIDTFAISFLTAEYTVHIGYGTYIQAQKVLIMNNGTTAYSQEYGIMYEPTQIVSIGATVSGSNVLLEVTPETGITGLTTYRFVRNTLI